MPETSSPSLAAWSEANRSYATLIVVAAIETAEGIPFPARRIQTQGAC